MSEPDKIDRHQDGPTDATDAAELQLIDALLRSISQQAADDREKRVRRVMAAIEDTPTASGARPRPRLWQSLGVVAACLAIACTLSWMRFSRESQAAGVLREVAGVSLERIDRVYSLQRIVSADDRTDLQEGRLYLRGCDGFVIECSNVVLGGNVDEFWFVPQDGPVIIAEDFEWMVGSSEREAHEIELLNVLAVDSRSLPLVRLSSAVELMRHDYDVTLDDDLLNGRRFDLLVGALRQKDSNLPETIRIWSDKESRIIERTELEWRRSHTRSPANLVVLELAEDELVEADWYDHKAHHAADRPLHRISSGS